MDRDPRYSSRDDVVARHYQLTSRWSDRLADQIYFLSTLVENSEGERHKVAEHDGDRAWAERIAKHYNIELPEEEEK